MWSDKGERKRKVVGLVEKEGGNSPWSIIKVFNSSPWSIIKVLNCLYTT